MSKQVVDLQQVLLKIQATFGTMETTLDTPDFSEPSKASLSFEPTVTPVELTGAGFSQNQSVVGALESAITLSYPMRTTGVADKPGDWTIPLKGCGFKETPTSHVYVYTPSSTSSDWKDITIWGYSGNKASSAALLTKIGCAMFGAKINLDFDKAIATIDFTGKGVFSAAPAAATQPTTTKSAGVTKSLVGSTISFFSSAAYIPLSIDFDIATDVYVLINPSTAVNGKGITQITKRKITWSAKVYRDHTTIPEGTLVTGTLGTISVAWGTKPNSITIASTKAQIAKAGYSEQNGVETLDLSGPCVDNDLTITVDTEVPV